MINNNTNNDISDNKLSNFNTLWDIDGGMEFIYPSTGNFVIDWGDGCIERVSGVCPGHIYARSGCYVVSASIGIRRFDLRRCEHPGRLLEVCRWGCTVWDDMSYAFYGGLNMTISATDAPDLSRVNYMYGMLTGCDRISNISSINIKIGATGVRMMVLSWGTYFIIGCAIMIFLKFI